MWCGILISAAGFNNNGGMLECSMAEIELTTIITGEWGTICESKKKCTICLNVQ